MGRLELRWAGGEQNAFHVLLWYVEHGVGGFLEEVDDDAMDVDENISIGGLEGAQVDLEYPDSWLMRPILGAAY